MQRCQFSQISRLNDLVTSLYEEFRDNILSGEHIQVQDELTGAWAAGVLKQRVTFLDRPEMSRYFVQIHHGSGSTSSLACADRQHIQRKPRTFTKHNLQRFLRHTISRDRYEGAPWVVKPKYAEEYNLDTQLPPHLTQEAITAERKLHMGLKKGRLEELPPSFMVKDFHVMPRPGAKPSKQDLQYVHEKFDGIKHNGQHVLQLRPIPSNLPSGWHGEDQNKWDGALAPIKYPIEDLQLELKKNTKQRPRLQDFTEFALFPADEGLQDKERLKMDAVGPLLETWNTLTVFAEFFDLDGFVFDDFAGALYVASERIDVPLFSEVHCAVLNHLVDEEGTILADTLVKAGINEDSDTSSEEEEGSLPEEPLANGAVSNSDVDGDVEMRDSPSSVSEKRHRAKEMLSKVDWVDRLRNRKHQDKAWTLLMVGLLDQLSSHPNFRNSCESILCHLAPLDKPATAETVFKQYMSMDVNLRIVALEIPTMLITETKPFKEFMERLVGESTETRKTKVSLQSQRRSLNADITKLDQQAKLLRPDSPSQAGDTPADLNRTGITPSDSEGRAKKLDEEGQTVADSDESKSSDDEDEQPSMARRISNRAINLKRKRALEEEQKQQQEETKEAAEYRKVLKDFDDKSGQVKDLEDEIERYDKELRENACHRTKLLGRDRFLNRYIWFERNGMPFEIDSRSTDYGYANGRLWVQGPDLIERMGILDMERTEEKQYKTKFQMTMQQRRDLEEGDTHLYNANQWGYYDDPADVDRLIDWLNPKGEREKALKKELTAWRHPIQEQMTVLKEHIEEVNAEYAKLEDRPVGIATRKKLGADLQEARYPCLRWSNEVAYDKYGQPLSMGPPLKRAKKNRTKAGADGERETSAPPEKRTTRQGTRFAR